MIGGARGIKSMIWETSNLDADEVRQECMGHEGNIKTGINAKLHGARFAITGANRDELDLYKSMHKSPLDMF